MEQGLELHCYIVESMMSQRRVGAVVTILAFNSIEVMKPFTLGQRGLFNLFPKQVKLGENQQEVLMKFDPTFEYNRITHLTEGSCSSAGSIISCCADLGNENSKQARLLHVVIPSA